MPDDSSIAVHANPVGRERTNYIARLDLTQDGLPGRYEQVWTRTTDQELFELCCVPFFAYGLSLGDTLKLTSESGTYEVVSKSGNRTIRFSIQDQRFAHEEHEAFHGSLTGTGALIELSGHASSYGAVNCADDSQVDAVLAVLNPLAVNGTLLWEWAAPTVQD